MQFMDFQKEFEDKFKKFFSGMKREDIPLAQKGKEKLRVRSYKNIDSELPRSKLRGNSLF